MLTVPAGGGSRAQQFVVLDLRLPRVPCSTCPWMPADERLRRFTELPDESVDE